MKNTLLTSARTMMAVILMLFATNFLPLTTHLVGATGNDGTLKVHEQNTLSDTESNDPQVCTFNFEGFGFDKGQSGLIKVEPQGKDSDTTDTAELRFGPADANGYYQTDYLNDGGQTLANGHYKSTLYGKDTDGAYTIDLKAKSKVFKVECNSEGPTTPTDTPPSVTPPAGGMGSGEESSGDSGTGIKNAGTSLTAAPKATDTRVAPQLANTGVNSTVGVLVGLMAIGLAVASTFTVRKQQ